MNKCLPAFIARFTKAVQKEYKSARDAYSANEKSSKKRSKRKGEHTTILLVVIQEKPNQLDFVCTVYNNNKNRWAERIRKCEEKGAIFVPPPREPIAPHSLSPHIISSICKSSETRNIMRMQLRVSESGIGVVTMRVGESGIKVGRIKRVGESGIKVDRMNLPVKAGVRMFRRDASVMSQKPIS